MLTTILKGLQMVPAAIAKATEFKALIDAAGETLSSDDQAELKAAYEDHIEASDDAHSRFQERLKDAERR